MNNSIAGPTQRELMQELRVTHLRCQIQAIEPIELPAQPGSALRGA